MKIEQKAFLKTYSPEDKHITNWGEYNLICKVLDLRTISKEEICQLRDEVVDYYDELADKCRETDKAKSYDYITSMMSVTAVIDDIKWKIGVEI